MSRPVAWAQGQRAVARAPRPASPVVTRRTGLRGAGDRHMLRAQVVVVECVVGPSNSRSCAIDGTARAGSCT
jgi:hypothetical protein